jgi:tRNA-splicing endonuclease subunit Sen2
MENNHFVEYLQLSLEEAFFLQHALNCLIIETEKGKEMTINECWKEFCNLQPRFIYLYASYYHYRSCNWIPKSGLKYGVDWILYRNGPLFDHSEKTVIVIAMNLETKCIEKNNLQREISWLNLLNFNRVTEQVRKKLILCLIYVPTIILENINIDYFFSKLQIEEIEISRWIPSQTRQ